jgi:hypothetical protein
MRPDHALQTFDAEVDRLELNIAEVTARLVRITPGVPPAWPLTMADSAAAALRPPPAKIQTPSAISLPDRITNAKHNLSSLTLPECPLSMRIIKVAVQWS